MIQSILALLLYLSSPNASAGPMIPTNYATNLALTAQGVTHLSTVSKTVLQAQTLAGPYIGQGYNTPFSGSQSLLFTLTLPGSSTTDGAMCTEGTPTLTAVPSKTAQGAGGLGSNSDGSEYCVYSDACNRYCYGGAVPSASPFWSNGPLDMQQVIAYNTSTCCPQTGGHGVQVINSIPSGADQVGYVRQDVCTQLVAANCQAGCTANAGLIATVNYYRVYSGSAATYPNPSNNSYGGIGTVPAMQTAPSGNTAAIATTLTVQNLTAAAANITTGNSNSQMGSMTGTTAALSTINTALGYLNSGVQLAAGDYTVVGSTAAGSSTNNLSTQGEQHVWIDNTSTAPVPMTIVNDANLASITFTSVPVVGQTQTLAGVYSDWVAHRSTIPIFGLLNNFSVSVSCASALPSQYCMNSVEYGQLCTDLNNFSFSTAIAIFNFGVIGSAFVAAYFIIYS